MGLTAEPTGLVGVLTGHAVGGLIVSITTLYMLLVEIARPARCHFRSLYDYRGTRWLGSFKAHSFNDVGVLLLNVFIQ